MKTFKLLLASIVSLMLLAGCAGVGTVGSKYMNERNFEVNYVIDMQQATDIAALAVQSIDRSTVTEKNTATGFIAAKRIVGWWVNKQSFFLEMYISTPSDQIVKVHITTIAGPEVAFTDELDDMAEDFYDAYEKALSNYRP